MEFLEQNFYDTTTSIEVNSNTLAAQFLMDPDVRYQATSSGMNDDTMTYKVRIMFDSTLTVDRLALQSINVKGFKAYYNDVTANVFALVGGDTTVVNFLNNAEEDLYLPVTGVACTSVSFDFKTTMTADVEKAIGFLMVSQLVYNFARIPSAQDFTPIKNPKQLTHQLSTGGTRTHTVANKWSHRIKFEYIDGTFRDSLLDVYNRFRPQIFVPFGTTTAWEGVLYEANWVGGFEFYKYSDNAGESGYSGQIQLAET